MAAFPAIKSDILSNISAFENSCKSVLESFPLSVAWIERELVSATSLKAEALLRSSQISMLEACSTWSCGFNRSAAASLRSFCEASFSWLYYKDHSVEYSLVETRQEDLMLPKAVQGYLKKIDAGFEVAYSILSKEKTRSNEYYYTDLSFFVHAHPAQIISNVDLHKSAVSCPPEAAFITVCKFLDEFISDNFATYMRHSWGAVPALVQENLQGRLGNKLQKFIAA